MATTVSTTIPADSSNLGYWEKTVTDMNNIDDVVHNTFLLLSAKVIAL